MNLIRTVIIDDERYACERMKKLLTPFKGIHVLHYFTDSRLGLDYILKHKPDLLFLDVELEDNVSAFDIMSRLEDSLYRPQIILVTAYPHYSIKAIKHMVFDYILKPVDIDELKDTINRFKKSLSLESTHYMKAFEMLTERESEVLKYVIGGKNSHEIADLLYINVNTVHTHRRNILKKTGARTVVDLLRIKSTEND